MTITFFFSCKNYCAHQGGNKPGVLKNLEFEKFWLKKLEFEKDFEKNLEQLGKQKSLKNLKF